jgi:hypothetical protein
VGPIAQSVEQRTFNPWVDGSSPSGPTYVSRFSKNSKAKLRVFTCADNRNSAQQSNPIPTPPNTD